jgi:hypothetical protein
MVFRIERLIATTIDLGNERKCSNPLYEGGLSWEIPDQGGPHMTTTKEQTLDEIARAWQEFQEILKRVPPERVDEPGLAGQWSVKDIIGYITTWEVEMMRLVHRYTDTRNPMVLSLREDIDVFNERTIGEKRARPLTDLLDELHKAHEIAVEFVENMDETLFDVAEVDQRVRMDLYDHYREHSVQISRWLSEAHG